MPVMDVAQAREELIDLVDLVQDGEKVLIIGDDRNAALMSEEKYRSILETLYLLSDPGMAGDLDRVRKTPVGEMEVWKSPDTEKIVKQCR